ncbi:MAG: serine/threonine-protein kinase [Polyangiaceae bacterium]
MLTAGQCIGGRYRLLRPIGEGGMGVVWAAKNEAIDRDVAIKLMSPALALNEDALQRFFSEARICGSIRHPGIVDVLDLGRNDDGAPFLVMELLDGVTLEKLLERHRRLRLGEVLPIVRQVARTLALAHDKRVVHRDLKPANVFIHRSPTGDLIAKVLDFGISKILGPGSMTATRTGMMVGTPAYMSPEQAGGRLAVDERTDVYSLGVMLFEGVTGGTPFDAPTPQALLIDLATTDPPPVQTRSAEVPAVVAAIIDACLVRDRERRIQSARELALRIDEAMRAAGIVDEMQALDLAPSTASPRPPAPGTGAGLPADGPGETPGVPGASADATGPTLESAPHAGPSAGYGAVRTPEMEASLTVAPTSSTDRRQRARPHRWVAVAIGSALILLGGLGAAWIAFGPSPGRAASSEAPASPVEADPAVPTRASPPAEPPAPAVEPTPAAPTAAALHPPPPPSATSTAGPSAGIAGPKPAVTAAGTTRPGKPRPSGAPPAPAPPKGSGSIWGWD